MNSSKFAFLTLSCAFRTAEGALSYPIIAYSKPRILFKTDSSIFSNKSTSQSFQRSKPNSFLFKLGGILHAIIAASINNVPLPHIGSKKCD